MHSSYMDVLAIAAPDSTKDLLMCSPVLKSSSCTSNQWSEMGKELQ